MRATVSFAAPDALSIINRPFGEDPILPGAGTW